jgi:hypothetical protein
MICRDQKYQGETPLDYQYTFNFLKNEEQKGKINLFQGCVLVGGVWAQGKRE